MVELARIVFGLAACFFGGMVFVMAIWYRSLARSEGSRRFPRAFLFNAPSVVFLASSLVAVFVVPGNFPLGLALGIWPLLAMTAILIYTSAIKKRKLQM